MDGFTHAFCKTRYSLDGLSSFFHYQGVAQKAIKSLKYRFVFDLAQEFIGLIPLVMMDSRLRGNDTIMAPVPLHPSRLRFRGFNQAEKLGTILTHRLDVPFEKNVLKRVVKTPSQVEVKDREKRLKNMDQAFAIHDSTFVLHNSSILLFDDVWTTGATLRSATRALKRAGASRVWGVTMAR